MHTEMDWKVVAMYTFSSILSAYCGLFFMKKLWQKRYRSNVRLDGKTVAITGASTGLGKAIAFDLSTKGAKVLLLCRDIDKAYQTALEIKAKTSGQVTVYQCDMSSMQSVRDCVQTVLRNEEHIHILINNTSVFMRPYQLTQDNFELHMSVNYFGPFLLTNLLLDRIKASAPARIITVSHHLHSFGSLDLDDMNWEDNDYGPLKAFMASKVANILFSSELARRLTDAGAEVTTYAVHPGHLTHDVARHLSLTDFLPPGLIWFIAPFTVSAEEAADTVIKCAVDERLANESGKYYADCRRWDTSREAQDPQKALSLWLTTEEILARTEERVIETEEQTETGSEAPHHEEVEPVDEQ